MSTKYEIESIPVKRGTPPMRRIKLTPKGKRWADVIRKELENPDSIVSCGNRELKAWWRLAKSNPLVQLEVGVLGNIEVCCYKTRSDARNHRRWDSDHHDICYPHTVEYLFEKI